MPEWRDLNILAPSDGAWVFPGDTLLVRISTPGNPAPVTAHWDLPDGSRREVELSRTADPLT